MDEDDNISNADISMDDDDEEEPGQQQQQQQQHADNPAAAAASAASTQRRTRSREHEDDDESSDIDHTYALQFQLANVAGRNEPNSSAGINDSPRRRHNAATAAAGAAAAGTGTATAAGTGTAAGTAAAAGTGAAEANSGGAGGGSPFQDWDSQGATPRSSAGAGGGQEETAADASSSSGTGASSNSAGAKPSFFFGTSSFILRSRKEVAALINTECCRGGPTPDLDSIMDTLFNSGTPIDNPDNIEWIRWLIAGGRTPKEFVKIGKSNTRENGRRKRKRGK